MQIFLGERVVTRRGRILSLVAGIGGLCAVYLWFFGFATMFAVEARYVGWKMPVVRRTPVELFDLSISQAPGKKLSYLGYEFEVPWDVNEEKTKQRGKTSVVIALRSGNAIWFSRVPPKEFVNNLLTSSKVDAENLRKLYGEDALHSDYSLTQLVLEVTPQKVGPFSARRDAVGTLMLVVIKGIMMPRGGESGIFRIRTGNFQGFQYGDPRSRPKSLDVEIFAADGGLAFLFAQRDNGPTPAITQAEINRVIQTVRRVPDQELVARGRN